MRRLIVIVVALACLIVVFAGSGSANDHRQCLDTRDNDGDGKIDYPNDPDCNSRGDNSENSEGGGGTTSASCGPRGSAKTITTGGTYSGCNWSSVVVDTSSPVVIDRATISGGPDRLVKAEFKNQDLTLKNSTLNVTSGEPAVIASEVANLVVENNSFSGHGLYVYKFNGPGSIKVRFNKFTNVMANNWWLSAMFQANNVWNAQAEVAWNEMINEPGQSNAQDVINIYSSGGTNSNPYLVHNNFVRGGYAYPANGTEYYGVSINLGDSVSPITEAMNPKWIRGYSNVIAGATNAGIIIPGGHDIAAYDNYIVASGELPSGERIRYMNVGLAVWDHYRHGPSYVYNNDAYNNTVGLERYDGSRADYWIYEGYRNISGNVSIAGDITRQMETDAYNMWLARVASAGVMIGP